ncbi:ribosomal large subunit pseudouridine synthase E [Chondrocystis sp. NIES-4102]|nr:ribosomal large subunit pseudouridine synthase E [Chondrocystis sp. NIES-4102]
MKYILFYKPYGVLCQFTDDGSEIKRATLKDYIPITGVYPVGRLDLDSEGLVLLTDNGQLQHRLADPKFAHPRTYYVQVEGICDRTALNKLSNGVTIKDYRTRKAQVHLLNSDPDLPPRIPPIRFRQTIPTCWLEMTLTEGRNRQVRRMTAAVGFPTLRLVRVALGNKSQQITLSGLQPGQWRKLTTEEVDMLIKFK